MDEDEMDTIEEGCSQVHDIYDMNKNWEPGCDYYPCPYCGMYYHTDKYWMDRIRLGNNSLCGNGYDSSSVDDECDVDRIQNAYNPAEAVYNDDGNVEYW